MASIIVSEVTAPEDADFAQVFTPADGPAVLVRMGGDPDARPISGRLANVEGCLGITDAAPVPVSGEAPRSVIEASAAGRAIVVWPPGTTVGSDPYSLTSQGHTYRRGDEIAVGGGWVHLIEEDPFYSQIPKACRSRIFLY